MNNIKNIFYAILLAIVFSQSVMSSELEKLVMPGELARVHEKFEASCEECHQSFNKIGQNELCMSCHDHANIKNDVAEGTGYHGRIKNMKNINEAIKKIYGMNTKSYHIFYCKVSNLPHLSLQELFRLSLFLTK